MRAGLLRHRVLFERLQTVVDVGGDRTSTWVNALAEGAEVAASIEPLRGREFAAGTAIRADMDTRIVVRWAPELDDLNELWRIRHGATVYNIYSSAHIALRNREVEIMAKTGLNQG